MSRRSTTGSGSRISAGLWRRRGPGRTWHDRGAGEKAKPAGITASAFVWRNPKDIPPRQRVYGRHLIRKFLSTTAAPGGIGKSSLVLAEAVAMASGRNLLGIPVGETKLRSGTGMAKIRSTRSRGASPRSACTTA